MSTKALLVRSLTATTTRSHPTFALFRFVSDPKSAIMLTTLIHSLGPGKRQPLIALANGDQFITADKASKATLKTRSTLDGRGGQWA